MLKKSIPWFVPEYVLLMFLVSLVFIHGFFPSVLFAGQRGHHDLLSVSFPKENEGWACGRWGTIVHTDDGGVSWGRQQSGNDYTLNSICFVDTRNGWAVGDGGTILHTRNGGNTWERQESPVTFFLMGVHFADCQKGWISTERTHILYTENGGKEWRVQFKDKDFILKSISFCDARNGWAVGEYGYIYHTTDGGINWRRQAGEFYYSEELDDIVAGNFLFDVVAINPGTAWVVGIDGYIARTFDAGTTWVQVKNSMPKTHLFGITANGEDTVAIGGKGLLLSNVDGVETFSVPVIEPSIKYGWVYGMANRGSAGFVAVGKGGWIYLSDGKGATWRLAEN